MTQQLGLCAILALKHHWMTQKLGRNQPGIESEALSHHTHMHTLTHMGSPLTQESPTHMCRLTQTHSHGHTSPQLDTHTHTPCHLGIPGKPGDIFPAHHQTPRHSRS